MKIGSYDTAEQVLIVAEAGNNHEGDLDAARELVRQAARTGCHAVKFQTFRTEHYVGTADPKRFSQLKRYELGSDAFKDLADLARKLGLLFLSTPFDLESLKLIESVADGIKIASGDNDFVPLLRAAAKSHLPLIISTGASDLDRVEKAVDIVVRQRGEKFRSTSALLHCVTSYPAAVENLNLASIPFLADQFQCDIGFSDHTVGIEAPILAVAAGARIIEKHFTLEGVESDFRDHDLSLTPSQMADLVQGIRRMERIMGSPSKEILPVEQDIAQAVRRSIVAARDLPAGTSLTADDLTWIRPQTGLSPGQEDELVGRQLVRDVAPSELITPEDVA